MPNYTDMIVQFTTVLTDHFRAAGATNPESAAEEIVGRVRVAGGTSVENLAELTEADLTASGVGLPPLIARRLVRLASPPPVPAAPVAVQAMPAATAAPTIIVQNGDDVIEEAPNAVLVAAYNWQVGGKRGAELNARSRGEPFLLYVAGVLNVAASVARLDAIQQGRHVAAIPLVDGKPVRPLRVGESPVVEVAKENPLFPRETLCEPGETCEHTNESWAGVDLGVRQILYLAVVSGELDVSRSTEAVRAVVLAAHALDALALMQKRYPRAAVAWEELGAASRPTLEVEPARGGAARPPFRPTGSAARRESATTAAVRDPVESPRAWRASPRSRPTRTRSWTSGCRSTRRGSMTRMA